MRGGDACIALAFVAQIRSVALAPAITRRDRGVDDGLWWRLRCPLAHTCLRGMYGRLHRPILEHTNAWNTR
jgi:hypothetical protein